MNPRGGPAAGDDEEATTGPPLGCSDTPRQLDRAGRRRAAEVSLPSGGVLATSVVIVV